MPIQVMPLAADQKHLWYPLWRGYQTFYKADIPEAVSDLTWARLLDEAEGMGGALAWVDGKAVGFVHHIMHRSCWTEGDYCYLQDLFVADEARGQGIGRKLIEYVYDYAKTKRCSRVYWLTHETNTDAMQLYDNIATRSGFIQFRHMLEL